MDSRILSSEHARESGVAKPWEQTNEDWWDWYLSLADGSEPAPTDLLELAAPEPVPAPSLDELRAELAEPYPLTPAARDAFSAGVRQAPRRRLGGCAGRRPGSGDPPGRRR